MKKLFYCACVAALATACTNEELVPENNGTVSKGITFEATIEGTGIDSRGEMTNDYHFFWYAEQDRINVYADNVVAAGTNTGKGVVSSWNGTGNQPAVYKATKSASQGQFTAQDDNNLISFEDDYNAYFVALYPTTTTISSITGTARSGSGASAYTSDVNFAIKVDKSNASQSVAMNQVDAPMYSKKYGKRSASYESVGEKMALSFKRPFPVLQFTSATNTADLNGVIGKLNSVSITTKGVPTDASGYTLTATNIAAASATYNVPSATTGSDYVECAVPTLSNGTSTAEVTLTTPKTWGEGDNVYMSIYPVKREGTNGTLNKRMTEPFSVTYSYDKVTLTKNLSTSNDWNIQNGVYGIEKLNIANDFPWIVTDADSNGKRTLVVFKGNFSDIYKENTNQTKITWESATNGEVLITDVDKVISYVALTNAELQFLKNYTNLEELTLNANTSIPANVFDATLAGQITKLEMPLVTAIATTNNSAFSGLVNLNLKSYAFEEDDVYKLFFNSDVKLTLKTLNIEAVTSLRPTFGYDRTIVFTDYTKLETVALNPNGVALTASAFKGCEALKTVTGKVDIANAPDAFNGASTTAATHPTIEVVNTIIPNGAFQNALIKNIKKDGSQVVPTEIGEGAFAGNTLVEYMDLSQATTIGKEAFNGATKFVGTNDAGRNVVTVIATTVNEKVFAGSAVVRVQFKNATTLGDKIFDGCTALKQVKFLTKVTTLVRINSTTYAVPFGSASTTDVDLFVPTTQSDVNGLVWTLVGKTFKSITKEDTAWGN